jgi:hypothetical protein
MYKSLSFVKLNALLQICEIFQADVYNARVMLLEIICFKFFFFLLCITLNQWRTGDTKLLKM